MKRLYKITIFTNALFKKLAYICIWNIYVCIIFSFFFFKLWLTLTHPLMGICPATQACALDWELNQRPFGLQASTQSTEPHQPGLYVCILHTYTHIFVYILNMYSIYSIYCIYTEYIYSCEYIFTYILYIY